MDFHNIKPSTKDEVTLIISALSKSTSLEKAKTLLPKSVYQEVAKSVESGVSYEESVKNMKKYISDMKDIKVYLSTEPSKLLFDKIIDLFSTVSPFRYIEFIIDESMIGGVKAAIDGTFYDYSVNTLVDKSLASYKPS